MSRGDELPPGVIKMVKVYIAIKRKLQVGDKMAGRHGNKGVVSRIMPEEDMPYLEDGTPVDIVLNPLGVPSRMNVGQILETHLVGCSRVGGKIRRLSTPVSRRTNPAEIVTSTRRQGFAKFVKGLDEGDVMRLAPKLGRGMFFGSPVFDGAEESMIKSMLARAGRSTSGQAILFDGRTGEPFQQDVTVGVMYVLKLHHLVDDKIHARSIAVLSSRNSSRGKAQFGGQRLGEMGSGDGIYGALRAAGVPPRSGDDVSVEPAYESIVRGLRARSWSARSFNVLIKELQSLCLNVELVERRTRRMPAAED